MAPSGTTHHCPGKKIKLPGNCRGGSKIPSPNNRPYCSEHQTYCRNAACLIDGLPFLKSDNCKPCEGERKRQARLKKEADEKAAKAKKAEEDAANANKGKKKPKGLKKN